MTTETITLPLSELVALRDALDHGRDAVQSELDAHDRMYHRHPATEGDRAGIVETLGGITSAIAAAEARLAQPAYDQQALELCPVCGWKTLIPGDACLNCERGKPAEGCTPADARILREANHRMAQELHKLKQRAESVELSDEDLRDVCRALPHDADRGALQFTWPSAKKFARAVLTLAEEKRRGG